MMSRLKLAVIGCGGRGFAYMELASGMPDRYELVAGADPKKNRVERIRRIANNPDFREFAGAEEILAAPKMADVMIISTQDSYHFEPAVKALEKGYDLLLEKPIAQTIGEVLELENCARRLKRRVLICHVLRYTPFYDKIREILDSGIVGDIMTLNATEGVGNWHQAHSYVRGHWGIVEKSTPMIIAKCCHDTDMVSWLIGRECLTVSSFGALTHFTRQNCPKGAPRRCIEGCPAGASCPYNAMYYLSIHRCWLQYVFDGEINKLHCGGASREEILEWLKTSPWGRCVYRCDNTAVDHQVVGMRFDDDVTATLTMTAFAGERSIEIYGTKAHLHGGAFVKHSTGADIIVRQHTTGNEQRYMVSSSVGGYSGHGGGDPGLIHTLYKEMSHLDIGSMKSSIHSSVQSHVIGFAAEESRLSGKTVELKDFVNKHRKMRK